MKAQFFPAVLFVFVLLATACNNDQERKIKLAGGSDEVTGGVRGAASILQVSSEDHRTVAIFPFVNADNDTSIDWLSRGLADMFSSELSQSVHLHVFPVAKLTDISRLTGRDDPGSTLIDQALEVASMNKLDLILTGTFSRTDDVVKIQATMTDVGTRKNLRTETVHGSSLERIFTIVNELSQKLQENLPEDIDHGQQETLQLANMTESVEAFKCYSQALDNMDRFSHDEARSCLEKAIALDSSFAKAYMMLTRIKWMAGDEEGAYDCVRKALAREHRLTEQEKLWMRYVKADFDGDIPVIVSSVRRFLTLEPNDIETRLRLAGMLFELRRLDKAIEHYQAALALDPTLGIAYNQLAYLYTFQGDFATALEYVDKYADLQPEEPNPYDSKGEILLWAGRLQEASDNFKIALSKRRDYENSLKLLSVISSELDDIEKAEQYLDRWIADAANPAAKSHAHIRKAMLHWRFGEIEKAKYNLDLAQKVSPNSIYPVMVAAEMYRSVHDTMAARRLYERFFTSFDNLAEGNKPTAHELSYVLKFIMEAPLPASELIPVLTKITNAEKRALQRYIYQIHLGVLHLRNGSYEQGMEYLGQYSEDILTLITELPNYGWRMWRYHSEAIELLPDPPFDATERFLHAASETGRDDLVVIGNYFLAQLYSRTGEESKMRAIYADQGAPPEDDWLVIGPFKNRNGFQRNFPPENEFDTDAVYRDGERRLKWRSAGDGIYDGYIELGQLMPPASWAVGYGAISIYSPRKQPVQIRLGINNPCKLWLNNKLVWQTYPTKHVAFEDDIVSVMLHSGENNVLVKASNAVGDWGFYFRVTDENGHAVSGVEFKTPSNNTDAFALVE